MIAHSSFLIVDGDIVHFHVLSEDITRSRGTKNGTLIIYQEEFIESPSGILKGERFKTRE